MGQKSLTDEEFSRLVNYLDGSSNTLGNALDYLFGIDEDDIPISDNHRLDGVIFCCEQCGWWSEVSMMTDNESANGDWICTDCIPNEDD